MPVLGGGTGSPQIAVYGNLQDIFGNSDTNGSIVFQLCGYGGQLPRISGTTLLARTAPISIACPAGSFSTTIWGNDVITPAGTFYAVQVLDSNNNVILTGAYQFTGSGTVDLSTIAPYLTTAVPTTETPVLLNPTGAQSIALYPLTLVGLTINGNLTVTGTVSFGGLQTVLFSATPTFNAAAGASFKLTLTGNVTSSTFSGGVAGNLYTFEIIQQAGTSYTFVWPSNFKNPDTISSTLGSISVQSFMYDGFNAYPTGPLTIN